MSHIGSIIPGKPLGSDPRDKGVEKAKDRRRAAQKASDPTRDTDEASISAAAVVESSGGARSVKGNAEEESHEDRAEHGYYRPQIGPSDPSTPRPHLDISG